MSAPDANGWIEWKGGKYPVNPEARIVVFYRDGGRSFVGPASRFDGCLWDWTGMHRANDIMEYRVVQHD